MEFISKQKAQKLDKLVDSMAELLQATGEKDIAIGYTNQRLYDTGKFVFMSVFLSNGTVWAKFTKTQMDYVLAQLYARHNINLTVHYYTIGITGHGKNGDEDMTNNMTMLKPMEFIVIDEEIKHVEE